MKKQAHSYLRQGWQPPVQSITPEPQAPQCRRVPSKKQTARKNRWVLPLQLLCIAVAVFSAFMLVTYAVSSANTARTNRELAQLHASVTSVPTEVIIETPVPIETPLPTESPAVTPAPTATPKPVFHEFGGQKTEVGEMFYAENTDFVAWLNIDGVVNLPVVYRDNSYYLTHDFYKRSSTSGTLFFDVLHPLAADTQQFVIHGHNMKDNSMFGILSHYRDKAFAKKHAFATLQTLYGDERYALFAVVITGTTSASKNYLPYLGRSTFYSEASFNDFIAQIKKKALFHTTVEVTPEDALLTLSTCLDDDRCLVIFRKMQDGESESVLKSQISVMY